MRVRTVVGIAAAVAVVHWCMIWGPGLLGCASAGVGSTAASTYAGCVGGHAFT